MTTIKFRLFALFLLGACAAKGTRPHDMAAEAHEAEAESAKASAAEHAGQYGPAASETTLRCHAGKGGRVCWSALTNPTAEHLRSAEAMSKLAAEHRAASEALRSAEAAACADLAAEDRDISPFAYTADVVAVDALTVTHGAGKTGSIETVGAVVTVRAVPGLTAEWLQRVVDCHVARAASLGHAAPGMPDCPLVPAGVSAKVASTGSGFQVEIRSADGEAAGEVLARARRLLGPSPE